MRIVHDDTKETVTRTLNQCGALTLFHSEIDGPLYCDGEADDVSAACNSFSGNSHVLYLMNLCISKITILFNLFNKFS